MNKGHLAAILESDYPELYRKVKYRDSYTDFDSISLCKIIQISVDNRFTKKTQDILITEIKKRKNLLKGFLNH